MDETIAINDDRSWDQWDGYDGVDVRREREMTSSFLYCRTG